MDPTYQREDPLLVDDLYNHPYDGMGRRRGQSTNECCCNRSSCHSRWAVLVPICFMVFGSFYNYDFPGTLGTGKEDGTIQARFENHNKTYTQEMNQVLYSVYSWPNVVLALVGGFLIDKILGIRKSLLLFTFLIALGTGLFWVGTLTVNYPLLVLGRVMFGIGGENGYVAQASMTSRWFKGTRGMALAYGLALATNRSASLANFYLALGFAEDYSVQTSTFIGFVTACFSFLCGTVLFLLDVRGERYDLVPSPILRRNEEEVEEEKDKNAAGKEEDGTTSSSSSCCSALPPRVLWLIAAIVSLSFCSLYPFLGIAKNYFEVTSQNGASGRDASRLVSIFEICAVVGCPLFGAIVALTGRMVYFMVAAGILVSGAYVSALSLGEEFPPVVFIVMLGIASAIIASSGWSTISLSVPRRLTGLSFGISLAIVNLGLAVVPLITGRILTANTPASSSTASDDDAGDGKHALPTIEGFTKALSVLLSCSIGAIVLSIILFVYSLKTRGPLINKSSNSRSGSNE